MRRTLTGKQNITLCLRVPKEEALRIIGRLWAKGLLSNKQYLQKLDSIDNTQIEKHIKKQEAISKFLEGKNG